ncbi:MAG TPA: hypothetical protein VNT24_13725 [Propionibacteriaceae bacterium]|nr:hypothetical protein [Propionibacteriaceae bacterium]
MFDSSVALADLDAIQLADAVTDNQTVLHQAECRVLELACAWADVHSREPGDYSPLVERSRFYGGQGTPAVEEFCVAEFGALLGTGTMAAQMLIADALDLRHRLPRLWQQILAGDVRAWQARMVAEASRLLTEEACAELDGQLSGMIGMLPWGRFSRILTAAVLDADPDLAAERERRARELRDVWAADSEDGLKTIIARAASGDAVWFMATINRIAEILAVEGDTDPAGIRRSKAIGILAQPAEALRLLAAHRTDPAADTEPAPSHDLDEKDDLPTPPEFIDSDPIQTSLNIDPPTAAQLRAGRPKVVLVYHLADAAIRRGHGLARPEHGEAVTLSELRKWLADTGCPVTVRPVLDPADTAPIDSYEIPQWMRDAVRLRNLADVFPYGSATTATMDLDHTLPWIPLNRGGPPGQTRPGNLGPYTRAHHRLLTHGHWQRRQPEPGTYLYKTPTGQTYLVTNQGTHRLGTTDFAKAVWHATAHADTEEEAC